MSIGRATGVMVGIVLSCLVQYSFAREAETDVSVQWSSPTKLFPDSETGRFYPGELLKVRADGRIDRNHYYGRDCHTEWIVVKKCHDVSLPVWVTYPEHPLVMAWLSTEGGIETTLEPRSLLASGLTLQVPKIKGRFDAIVRIAAYVPDQTGAVIDRSRSYGAYRFFYEVDESPRIEMLKEFLNTRRSGEALRKPDVLNRRLKEAEPISVALLLIEHVANHWGGGAANSGEREDILRIAQDLASGNREVSAALSRHYLSTGNFVAAEQQVRERMRTISDGGRFSGRYNFTVAGSGD